MSDPAPPAEVLVLRLGPEAAGLRLDRALADRLPEQSRSVVERWIDAGRVEVDGRVLPRKTRLRGGEVVRVVVPPPPPTGIVPEERVLVVLHEDEHLLVLDKPAGTSVHPGSGRRTGTIANALVARIQGLPEGIGADRPGIVHRLDKDTSGAMVVAKSDLVQRRLSESFAARRVEKTYLAIVHGVPGTREGTIDLPLGRSPKDRKKMAVRTEGGRAARTRWAVERALARHALLRCHPVTGRTHQIRVHLRAIHHPIVGDPLYGSRRLPEDDLAPRLMLHAWRISFPHPLTGEAVAVEAPVPADLRATLEALPPA